MRLLICALLVASIFFVSTAGVAVLKLYPTIGRIDEAGSLLLDCVKTGPDGKKHGDPDCLPSMIRAVGGSLRKASGEVAKAAPEIAQAAKDASKQSVEASRQATVAAKETTALIVEARGTVKEVTALVKDLRNLVQEGQKDLGRLTRSTDDVLKPLAGTMRNIEKLAGTLEQEIAAGGPKARETFEALTKAILDFDKLLADENLAKILANVEGSTKSIDMALRPWRERAHALKIILTKIAGIMKINIVDLF
jgi:phage-related tail protein